MRLRNIKGATEKVANSRYVIQEAQQQKGSWEKPIHIEIGMGKGQFITTLAQQNTTINYVGIERYESVIIRAIDKQEELELPNLRFLCVDAASLPEIFAEGEVERIYLNFSDPWPKERHARRRLTSVEFFARYDQILAPDGVVEFKTDNQELFTFSLEAVQEAGWQILLETRDLHHSEYAEGNIMTEYEKKFSEMGNPICKLVAGRTKANMPS